ALSWATFAPGIFAKVLSIRPTGGASATVVIALCVINAVFEEFLWLAYGFTAFSRFGFRTAIVASAALPTAIHSYQGVLALISIPPVAFVFTIFYAGTKRLWPVVVAHVVIDAISLLAVVRK